MKRLLIIADHSLIAHTIKLALRQTAGFEVAAVVDGRYPIRGALTEHRPDVVVIDEMQDHDHALARLHEAAAGAPDARRLLITLCMDDAWISAGLDAGAEAVLSKAMHPVSLGTVLREVVRGNVVHRYERRTQPLVVDCSLTGRELEILRLAAEGNTNCQIARALWVTEQTVKFHLSNTYRKLGVSNRTEASNYAHRHDLLAEPQLLAS